jgi:hypothetical protein
MRGIATAAAAATSMLIGRAVAADVDPIVIKGSKFFYGGNGTQLYVSRDKQDIGEPRH